MACPYLVLSFEDRTALVPRPVEAPLETVIPFRAWRYSPSAGDLSQLVAPPYDVIGADLQSRLYAHSRHNVVRVDLGMTTPSDNECDNQYTRAADQLAQWKEAGILVRDAQPSVTFVEETFTGPDGRPRVRHGFLALMRLFGLDEGVVFPHEQTFSGPKEDRYRLLSATAMSLSPVFLLYDLPGDEVSAAWKTGPGAQAPFATVTDEAGTVTRLWPTTDPELLAGISRDLAATRFVIADGHHRYETALRYKMNRLPETSEPAASDYALAYFSNMSDPGLAIYGTHRLLSGVDVERIAALPRSLAGMFDVEPLAGGTSAGAAKEAITEYLEGHPRGAFGLWGRALDGPYGLQLTDTEAALSAAPGHSAAYQLLDVTVLQTLILEKTLGIASGDSSAGHGVAPVGDTTEGARVTYFKDPDDAFARLEAEEFQIGFFLNPTGLDQIREVAFGGERMPQKATYFYPKLPTGLVFLDLSDSI
jgi:uncharacterized protein (DUF1015 family)